MTYNKITETEFKNWSKQLEKICNSVLENINIFPLLTVAKEKEDFVKIVSLAIFHSEKGVLSAIFGGLLTLEAVGLQGDSCTVLLGGLTFEEWEKQILQRMKEHCIANGYYNPNSPSDLALLKTRRSKVNKALKDKNKLAKLLTYADSEDYRIITTTVNFIEQIYKLMPGSEKGDGDVPEGMAFLVEDHVGRVEKLMNEIEENENSNNPSQPTDNSPTPPKPAQQKNNLEKEIQRLQDQVRELEGKINTTTDTTQKTTYQSILDSTKKDIKDKEREKDKLNNKQENPSKSNNSKVNLAIGLGIVAVLIGLICLLLLINKRKER